MRALVTVALAVAVVSCAGSPDKQTLAKLHSVPADVAEVAVDDSLDRALDSYRRFLDETPNGPRTPEAMRRLADLKLEQQFGLIGDGEIVEMAAPEGAESPETGAPADLGARAALRGAGPLPAPAAASLAGTGDPATASGPTGPTESDQDFEARTTAQFEFAPADSSALDLPANAPDPAVAGPLEAIEIYKQILDEYPYYERRDQVLYQMARAYDEIGEPDEAMRVMEQMVGDETYSRYIDEVHFRRGEYLFTRKKFFDAESAYQAIIDIGSTSEYYELALYKLGWALYKQELYDEALDRFMALLDYKLSTGYDFDQNHEEDDERRVADTFRVISLSFSNIGGPEVVSEYFSAKGARSFEDRIYSNLGEFYLSKLRYQDAAAVYGSFVELNPYHKASPRFSMRIIDIYGQGDFPLLVVESKKDFAEKYGLGSDYWDYFDAAESPEVIGFLKTNLTDLANHYHSLYQDPTLEDEKLANYDEASRWYREFLSSFPAEPESPGINYQLADLLLENEDFGAAAVEFERTAYDYASHEQAAAAGYAAIYAHRQHLAAIDEADEAEKAAVLRATVDSSLKFADTFPEHENAAVVLGAATDDLYAMGEYEAGIEAGRKLVERYPAADPALRRSAWTVIAHGSFDLERYAEAEEAYVRVLEFVPETDDDRQALVDNLAASIYQQGAQANTAGDYLTAANHFLRIREIAPGSKIRPAAEYDAAAALIRLEDWARAASVLEAFRQKFPEHELNSEATKQLAFVYRQAGELGRSASEYERVAAESDDPEVRGEAMLVAGDLYEQAADNDAALDVYARYVAEFPRPLDVAQETRFKMAGMYEHRGDVDRYHEVLRAIVESDRTAGGDRTDRSRFLAAQSGLVLTKQLYDSFLAVELTQPFDKSLAEKQRRMSAALEAFENLVDYEVSEVTAAATYHIAEIYYDFSQSLLHSERPTDLDKAALVDYDLALEEEAFPFEERAIETHEQNFALIRSGIFNSWVQQSLDRLAALVPGRYAKNEISSGFVGSIDVFAYHAPNAELAPSESAAQENSDPPAPEGQPAASTSNGPSAATALTPSSDAAAPEVTSALAR
jgi:tetratricopeptide (TPR) repeat protein